MHADLERVIALQGLDSSADEARHRLTGQPERMQALDARLEAARQQVADVKERLAANQADRRSIEKDVAVHQGRLSKFREQAMAVKTNQEYHAIQHEIAFAQAEIKTIEDRILERMLEADDLTAELKRAEAALAAEQKAVDQDRRGFAEEAQGLEKTIARVSDERAKLVALIDPQILATYDVVARRRNGMAVAEARDGICTLCHVRLRPQVFNTIRRNETIIQCDSCNRILFFKPVAQAAANVEQPAS